MSDNGLSVTVELGLTEAVERVKDALATQGFGILTEIDVAATLKAKLDVDIPPYLILGACMPSLAHRAIAVDPSAGQWLPCNVVLRAVEADNTLIQAADPELLVKVSGAAQLRPIAAEAKARISRALDTLRATQQATEAATVTLSHAELQLLKHALHSFRTDFGHDEADVLVSIHNLLAKLAVVGMAGVGAAVVPGAPPASSNGESHVSVGSAMDQVSDPRTP